MKMTVWKCMVCPSDSAFTIPLDDDIGKILMVEHYRVNHPKQYETLTLLLKGEKK